VDDDEMVDVAAVKAELQSNSSSEVGYECTNRSINELTALEQGTARNESVEDVYISVTLDDSPLVSVKLSQTEHHHTDYISVTLDDSPIISMKDDDAMRSKESEESVMSHNDNYDSITLDGAPLTSVKVRNSVIVLGDGVATEGSYNSQANVHSLNHRTIEPLNEEAVAVSSPSKLFVTLETNVSATDEIRKIESLGRDSFASSVETDTEVNTIVSLDEALKLQTNILNDPSIDIDDMIFLTNVTLPSVTDSKHTGVYDTMADFGHAHLVPKETCDVVGFMMTVQVNEDDSTAPEMQEIATKDQMLPKETFDIDGFLENIHAMNDELESVRTDNTASTIVKEESLSRPRGMSSHIANMMNFEKVLNELEFHSSLDDDLDFGDLEITLEASMYEYSVDDDNEEEDVVSDMSSPAAKIFGKMSRKKSSYYGNDSLTYGFDNVLEAIDKEWSVSVKEVPTRAKLRSRSRSSSMKSSRNNSVSSERPSEADGEEAEADTPSSAFEYIPRLSTVSKMYAGYESCMKEIEFIKTKV
jgi:hypothetical protein